MKIGDLIQVQACKTDGTVYRSWQATIESITADLIVTIAPAGSSVFNIKGEDYPIRHHYRAYYWLDKFYNLIEIFETSGELFYVYINVASPPEFKNGILSFKDHELDVVRYPPKAAELIDENEFAEAAVKYQYTKEFQEKMYSAANEALKLASCWNEKPAPEFGGEYVK